MGRGEGEENVEPISKATYCGVARDLGVPIININSANALNNDEIRGIGASLFLKDGEVAHQGAEDEEMFWVVDI